MHICDKQINNNYNNMGKWSDISTYFCKIYIKILIKVKLPLSKHTGSGGVAPRVFNLRFATGERTPSEATEHKAGWTPAPIWTFWGTDVS